MYYYTRENLLQINNETNLRAVNSDLKQYIKGFRLHRHTTRGKRAGKKTKTNQ
jgi:hypothetical protein